MGQTKKWSISCVIVFVQYFMKSNYTDGEQINSSLRWGHEEGQKCFYSHEKEVKGDGYINYLDCDSGVSGVYAVPTC